jgi:tetratricopeptide (TPR) repeat protein
MIIRRKTLLFFVAAAIGFITLIFLLKSNDNKKFKNQIPKLSESLNLSPPVMEQISEAYLIARNKPSEKNLGILGMVYHSSANYDQAAQCYKLAIRKKKSEWIWNYYLGYLNMEMGGSAAAIENFNSVIKKNPNISLAWFYMGEEYKNLRNNEKAEEAYKMILARENGNEIAGASTTRQDHFPITTYTLFRLSRLYFDTGRFDLAEKTLKEIIEKDYLFGSAYRLLGNIYNMQGNTTAGNSFTIRANDLNTFASPVDTLIDKIDLISRSELHLLKKIDEAERGIYSDWALRLVNQGLQYLPDNRYMLSKGIKIYLWKGLNEQAIGFTDKHLSLFVDDFNEIKKTGLLFFMKDLYPQAANYWKRALEISHDDNLVKLHLAKSLWYIGEKQKSFDVIDEMIGHNASNADILADVTELLFQFGVNDRAISNLEKLQRMVPLNPKVQRLTGERALARGETAKAMTLFESSLDKNPQDLKTIRNLGDLYMDKKMWNQYISHYRSANDFHPNNPEILARLGESLINCPDSSLRNINEGQEFSERAFTHYECPPDILIASGSHLSFAYALLGNKQKAISTITKTISIGRREKIPKSSMAKLEGLLKAFQNMSS